MKTMKNNIIRRTLMIIMGMPVLFILAFLGAICEAIKGFVYFMLDQSKEEIDWFKENW